ncbi:MAG TPA: cytochrome c oxidase subunit I [Candidatus Limnocylindrales bacterium]|jgi:cytochrome c oxidase subunit 1|nr:cytochrome c oxidase subunit I [Candidatus Limnocylindrales bacterium]
MATHALSPAIPAYRGGLYEWLTTTDHKKIGIMYVINSFLMFLIGGVFALLVRTELAQPGIQIFQNEHVYNESFTIHATVMIFLFIIPMLAGLGNYAVPLMIGAPDMAFPRINALSFWMLPLGAVLLLMGFLTPGGAAAAGWTSYPPLTERLPLSSPGPGQDLWIVSLVLIGTSSILGGINFLVTIFKMRAPGMTLFRMPIMVWTVLVTSVLVVLATAVFTSALVMLFIDRNYGGTFFLPPQGQAVLYQNVFWFYSHPAVYVMVLPAMGVISEVLPVFSRKPLFGYKAFIFATVGIGALGFTVWAHHMFTTGAVFLPFFSLMTAAIGVPTGVKMFNWIFTMFRGQLTFSTPLIFAIGFLTMFLIGGINGVFSAAVPVDFALHDTYWVVAHLHYVLFGGSVFGVFAGIYYWFPKMTGRMLDEGLGKIHFVLMFIGFNLTFFPMHMLGIKGMPRRIADYSSSAGWNDWNLLATIGGFIIAISILPFVWNVFVSLRNGKIAGDDPWEANTLEWATSSPPPPYNFDRLPEIRSERPLFDQRHGTVGGDHGGSGGAKQLPAGEAHA